MPQCLKCLLEDAAFRKKLFAFFLFLLCVLVAFAVRTWHYEREAANVDRIIRGDAPSRGVSFTPFTIESAMMYSYVEDVASGRGVPSSDKGLAGMEDLSPWRQMNMGLEWFLGWGYRVKSLFWKDAPPKPEETRYEDNPSLARWVSFQLCLWASLTSGFIFLWLLVLRCPWRLALFGGLLHAVALSAVARSTGQDIVRGEFCIPLIAASLLLAHAVYRKSSPLKLALLFASAFLAFATWDLCQMLFSCWAACEILRIVLGGAPTARRRDAWIAICMAIALNALLVPFNQTYGLIMSPLLLVVMPSLMTMLFWGRGRFAKRLALAAAVPLCLYGLWLAFVNNPGYASNYSHFSELMRAKLKFDNVKPADPRLLCYDARIMWTPSMHSATWRIAASFFPPIGSVIGMRFPLNALSFVWNCLPLTLSAFPVLILAGTLFSRTRRALSRGLPRSLTPCLFTIGFIVGFIYIVRYHEFVILFLCVALPLLVHDWLRAFRGFSISGKPSAIPRAAIWAACAFLLLSEAGVSLFGRQRAYSGDVYLRETAKLIEWFRRGGVKGKTVIADFTIGPMLKAYCGAGIAMQPQFGMERIRRPVEIFTNLMYHGDERSLNEFCRKYGAELLVYDKGYVGPLHIYSPRYMAAAVRISPDSPASMMYYCPDKLRWFYRLDPPSSLKGLSAKYTVFKVIAPSDRIGSMKLVVEGEKALEAGDIPYAARCAKAAVWLDPMSEQSRLLFFKATGNVPFVGLDSVH